MNNKLLGSIIVIMLFLSNLILPSAFASNSPILTIIAPTEGEVFGVNQQIPVIFNISDSDSSTITYFIAVDKHLLTSGATHTGQVSLTLNPLEPGNHTLNITVMDNDHNYDTKYVNFQVKNQPPSVDILYPPTNTATTATLLEITLYITDAESSTLTLAITNSDFHKQTSILTGTLTATVPLHMGTNDITIEVSDGYSKTTSSLTIDRIPVNVKILKPQTGFNLTSGTITIIGAVYTTTTATYSLLLNNQVVLTGTTSKNTTITYQYPVRTGTLTITLIAQVDNYVATDTSTVYIKEQPQVNIIFPHTLPSGVATLTIVSDGSVDNVEIYTDNMYVSTIHQLSTGTTSMLIQTQLLEDRTVHTLTLKKSTDIIASATFTATGDMPHIYDIGTPTQTEAPTILIIPTVEGASITYVYVNNNKIGVPPITYTPPEDGTYTVAINAIGGFSFSIWRTKKIVFIWKPNLSIKDVYWDKNKLNISIRITDYDKDTDMITIKPINLFYPVNMTSTTKVIHVEIPETYITVGSTLTIIAHDKSNYTSTLTLIVPGKIPPPHIVAPDPGRSITVFEDTVEVTVQVDATGTIYWYQDGYLTKKQPAKTKGRYTYMFFVPEVKEYQIYARLCTNVACSPNSETLIVKKGAFVKLWIGKTLYFTSGKMAHMDVSPFIDPRFNRTVVPIRFVANALGYNVDWNPQTRNVTLSKDNLKIIMNLKIKSKSNIKINNKIKTIYVGSATVIISKDGIPSIINLHQYKGQDMGEPVIVDNRTYVPVRFLSEILGAKVTWDAKTKGISILLIP